MTILVTGATGFIGRHCVLFLAARGHEVVACVRTQGAAPAAWTRHNRIRLAMLDGSASQFEPHLANVATVIHLAGLAAAPRGKAAEAALQAANVDVTAAIVAAAKRHAVRRFVNLSSIRAVAGTVSSMVVDDETAPHPAEPYGRSKLEGERLVAGFAGQDRLAVSVRPTLVIGPDAGGNWQRLQKLAASSVPLPFGGIANKRSYLAIGTLCAALAHLAEGDWPADFSGSYCLADPAPLALPEVLSALRRGMGHPPSLFRMPGLPVLQALPVLAGPAKSLFGDLVVDGSRFFERFRVTPPQPIDQAMAASGAAYLRASGQS